MDTTISLHLDRCGDMASMGRPQTVRRRAAKETTAAYKAGSVKPIGGKGRTSAAKCTHDVDDFVRQVARATPQQLVDIERHGVSGHIVKGLATRLDIPAIRVFDMVGVPKATVEKKASAGDVVSGSGGQAAIGMARLIGIAQELVGNSTAKEARTFDGARWLGQWLERPQQSLGGRRPAELIDTPTGVEVVTRLLGAIESGSYQ